MVHIPNFRLTEGDHDDMERAKQGCIMNVIAYLQGESPSDNPQGVDEAFRALAIHCNDNLPFAPRQKLMRFVPRLMNSKTDSWHELARRMERLLMLEREVCRSEYPLTGFLEHMGPNLPQRIACLVTQIVHATKRAPMLGRERELCEAIERALDDLLPDHELTPKQSQDLADLGHVTATPPDYFSLWAVKAVANVLKPVFKPYTATAVWIDEARIAEMIGEPA